jgi:hypothetical protein
VTGYLCAYKGKSANLNAVFFSGIISSSIRLVPHQASSVPHLSPTCRNCPGSLIVLSVVLAQFQLASAPQIRISDVSCHAAIQRLLVLIQMEKLLWTQSLEIGPRRQDGQMMRDRHDALPGKLSSHRS